MVSKPLGCRVWVSAKCATVPGTSTVQLISFRGATAHRSHFPATYPPPLSETRKCCCVRQPQTHLSRKPCKSFTCWPRTRSDAFPTDTACLAKKSIGEFQPRPAAGLRTRLSWPRFTSLPSHSSPLPNRALGITHTNSGNINPLTPTRFVGNDAHIYIYIYK